ncbi:hypothetical protein OU995_25765 [Roseateles sp. SL47]|uniref:hypothetical protein n=1 Tax=Roseateles sp. SL47 TaxID=2995138 RepID=UPI00226E3DB1|nr:hypothetical protein [Roseateles sp. SL47]WAC76013.1 hypothetical protein OU995_25765 [Roseateles sp. SL47]
MTAPSSDPCGLMASAAAIINTTYIQAMATRYMQYQEKRISMKVEPNRRWCDIVTRG